MFEEIPLFSKLWERLNLRGGLTFNEYTEIRDLIKDDTTRQMIDDMILGNKKYKILDVSDALYNEVHKITEVL